MRVEEEYVKTGFFWLPEQDENKIPGIITIKNGGEIELEVVGLFDSNVNKLSDLNSPKLLNRIIGLIEDDGLVTLDNCFYIKKMIPLGGISKSKLSVERVLSGAAYDKDEDVTYNSLSFTVDCLDEWVGISGIGFERDRERNTAQVTYDLPKKIEFNLDNGMQLEIYFSYTLPGFPIIKEAGIIQKTYYKLKSETLRPLDEYTKIAHKIVSLMCFAVDAAVEMKNLKAISFEKLKEHVDGSKYPSPISVYYSNISFNENVPNKNKHQMLFCFGLIIERAEVVFNNWINSYKEISPAINLYFSTKNGSEKYLDGKFLSLAQGLETYHRRKNNDTKWDANKFELIVSEIIENCPAEYEHIEWLKGRLHHGNEINFRKRLQLIIEPFKELLGDKKVRKKLLTKIVDTRNYLTHYSEDLKDKTATGAELWVVCQRMDVIFQLNFLNVIGFNKEEIDRVVKTSLPLKNKLNNIKYVNSSLSK